VNVQDRQPLFAEVSAEAAALADEMRALFDARWRLLRLEALDARSQLRRLAICLGIALLAALTSLPVFVVAAGDSLDGVRGLPSWAWHLISGSALLVGAALVAWIAWRRFRREFVGLSESIEELREDVVWLREFSSRRD
jgi:hypothetical protein